MSKKISIYQKIKSIRRSASPNSIWPHSRCIIISFVCTHNHPSKANSLPLPPALFAGLTRCSLWWWPCLLKAIRPCAQHTSILCVVTLVNKIINHHYEFPFLTAYFLPYNNSYTWPALHYETSYTKLQHKKTTNKLGKEIHLHVKENFEEKSSRSWIKILVFHVLSHHETRCKFSRRFSCCVAFSWPTATGEQAKRRHYFDSPSERTTRRNAINILAHSHTHHTQQALLFWLPAFRLQPCLASPGQLWYREISRSIVWLSRIESGMCVSST